MDPLCPLTRTDCLVMTQFQTAGGGLVQGVTQIITTFFKNFRCKTKTMLNNLKQHGFD